LSSKSPAFRPAPPSGNPLCSGSPSSSAQKNAIDFLYAEWVNKAAGIVSNGAIGGARAAEQLRLVMAQLQLADVQAQVMLSLFTDFENMTTVKPVPNQEKSLSTMLDQVVPGAAPSRRCAVKPKVQAPESPCGKSYKIVCNLQGPRP
jgi:hypothetical protein